MPRIVHAIANTSFISNREDYIGVADFNGNKLRMVISRQSNPYANLHHIFAISVFEDYIYWSDWETKSIERCHKYSGSDNKTVLSTIHRPMDLQIYHPMRQPWPEHNPCENNGGCEALCLLSPDPEIWGNGASVLRKTCACPLSFFLRPDGLTCQSNCSQSMFRCKDKLKCIPFWWKCDGQDDCGDGKLYSYFECSNTFCLIC